MFYPLLKRELALKTANIADWLYPAVFFILILVIFPLAIGTNKQTLAQLAVPIVWVSALFAIQQSCSNLFVSEQKNGLLAQLIISDVPLALWVYAKILVHWLFTGLLLMLVSVLVVPLYGLSVRYLALMLLTLLLGTPTLLLIIALAKALTIRSGMAQALVAIIAMPLQLPIIILAVSCVQSAKLQLGYLSLLALLLACLILSLVCIPITISYILKLMQS